jgi:hypothetical protein
VLATALPGAKSLEKVSENEFIGEMNVRIGPVAGLFAGKVIVSNEVAPESCTLMVEGKGNPGFVKGTGNILLEDQNNGTTLMKYDGDAQVGGKLASVGQRLLDTASKSLINQGLETLNLALQARVAAKSEGKEVEYTPPSEAKFISAVVKDMASEIFSSRKVWIGIIIFLVMAILIIIWLNNP